MTDLFKSHEFKKLVFLLSKEEKNELIEWIITNFETGIPPEPVKIPIKLPQNTRKLGMLIIKRFLKGIVEGDIDICEYADNLRVEEYVEYAVKELN